MQSLIKGGKKVNPDFEALNEIYVATIGDNFKEGPESQKQSNENLVLIDVLCTIGRSTWTSTSSTFPRVSFGMAIIFQTSTSKPSPAIFSKISWCRDKLNSTKNRSWVCLLLTRTRKRRTNSDEIPNSLQVSPQKVCSDPSEFFLHGPPQREQVIHGANIPESDRWPQCNNFRGQLRMGHPQWVQQVGFALCSV